MTTCLFVFATSFYLQRFFCRRTYVKVNFIKLLPLSWLLNLAPSTIILVYLKIPKPVLSVLHTDEKLTEIAVHYGILVWSNPVIKSNLNTNQFHPHFIQEARDYFTKKKKKKKKSTISQIILTTDCTLPKSNLNKRKVVFLWQIKEQ